MKFDESLNIILDLLIHLFIGMISFLLIAIFAFLVEIVLNGIINILSVENEIVIGILMFAKYGILIIDVLLLLAFVLQTTYQMLKRT